MSARRIGLIVVLSLGLASARSAAEPARSAESAPATSLVWIYGDDDALHAPAATRPASPAAAVGDRAGYDTLASGVASRFTGRENELDGRYGAHAPGLIPAVTTSAELAVALDLGGLASKPTPVLVEDRGSSVTASFALSSGSAAPSLSVRLYPFNADRERVGWLEILAWGGEAGTEHESPYAAARGPVRGGTLAAELSVLTLRLGFKTASFLEPMPAGPAVEETSYAAFGRADVDVGAHLGLGLGAGHFEHGRVQSAGPSPARATTTGASARAVLRFGLADALPPPAFGAEDPPLDGLEARDDGRRGVAVSLEAATLVERLRDFDEPGRTLLAPARAGAVVAEARFGRWQLRSALVLRDPAFVMRNVPGVFPGMTLPEGALTTSDWLALFGIAVRASRALTPALSVGLRAPAAVMTRGLDALGQPIGTTLVLYAPSDVELLPAGEAPVPVLELRPSLDVRLSTLLGAQAWLLYRRDFNRSRLIAAPGGALARGFLEPDRLGYGVCVGAAF